MKEKILQSLKNKYSNLGLSTETLEGVANQLAVFVKEETEIEPAVTGAENMLKSFQRFADSRVTSFKTESEKIKSEAEQLKAKLAELEKKEPPKEEPKGDELVKSLMKEFNEKFEALNSSLTKLSGERTHETLSQKLETLIGTDIPKSYYQTATIGRQFKNENEVTEFAETIKNGYEVFKQDLANQGFEQTRPPEQASGASDSKAIADMINAGTKEIVEQKTKN